jgi:hypothetical protein
MIRSTSLKWSMAAACAFSAAILMAQPAAAQAPAGPPAPAATPAPEHAPASGGGLSAADIAKSNNPLGEVTAISFENYYFPTLYGVPDTNANTFDFRMVAIAGRQIIRATVPVQTTPVGGGNYKSGLGDISMFDAIRISSSAKAEWAVGPLVALKTASDDALGSGKWQAGAALVGVFPMKGGSMLGFLATWQHSIAGDDARKTTNLSTLQPFATYSIGGGYYISSKGVMVFDFENNRYLIPIGVGFGKAVRAGGHMINAFFEPEFTLYHKGAGQPVLQLYAGIKWQWPKASKKG